MRQQIFHTANCLSLAVLLTAGIALAACSNDDSAADNRRVLQPSKTYVLSVDASKTNGDAETTRALSLDGTTLNSSWATTEHVFVKQGTEWLTGSLTPGANAAAANLSGAISDISGEPPVTLTLQFPRQEFSYTGQVGTLADIAAKYDYATASALCDLEGGMLTSATSVDFTNRQAIVKFTLKDKNNGDALISAESLRISANGLKTTDSETGDITITPASSTSELYAALSGISTADVTLTAVSGSKTYVYNKSGVTFTDGKYYEIGVKMHEVSEGAALTAVTADHIGWLVGQDGNVYSTVAKASAASTTAVAMIAYVSGTGHGLAVALTDESGTMTFSAAQTAASGKTPVTGGTWRLPTETDWTSMFSGCGGYLGFRGKLATAGGTELIGSYWANNISGLYDSAETIDFTSAYHSFSSVIDDDLTYALRACLAF